ncbi:unnamed protein product [Spodoptera exigua]|nr:unnamed protein product [Spodoptera exigua]
MWIGNADSRQYSVALFASNQSSCRCQQLPHGWDSVSAPPPGHYARTALYRCSITLYRSLHLATDWGGAELIQISDVEHSWGARDRGLAPRASRPRTRLRSRILSRLIIAVDGRGPIIRARAINDYDSITVHRCIVSSGRDLLYRAALNNGRCYCRPRVLPTACGLQLCEYWLVPHCQSGDNYINNIRIVAPALLRFFQSLNNLERSAYEMRILFKFTENSEAERILLCVPMYGYRIIMYCSLYL